MPRGGGVGLEAMCPGNFDRHGHTLVNVQLLTANEGTPRVFTGDRWSFEGKCAPHF